MTGKEKVQEWDGKHGESWSMDSERIAECLEEYLRDNSEAVAKPLLGDVLAEIEDESVSFSFDFVAIRTNNLEAILRKYFR